MLQGPMMSVIAMRRASVAFSYCRMRASRSYLPECSAPNAPPRMLRVVRRALGWKLAHSKVRGRFVMGGAPGAR